MWVKKSLFGRYPRNDILHCDVRNFFNELLEYIVRNITRPICEDTLTDFIQILTDNIGKRDNTKDKETNSIKANLNRICVVLGEKVHRVGYYYESRLKR